MKRVLLDLINDILINDHTPEEWLCLEREVDELLEQSSEENIQKFVDSGAGEMLDMICSGIRNMSNNN